MERDSDYPVYEKARAGSFQLSVASASLASAVDQHTAAMSVAPRSGEIHEALLDIQDYLESSGDLIAKYIDEPVPFNTFKLNIKARKAKLQKAIQDSTDAYTDLGEALGVIDAIEPPNSKVRTALDSLADSLSTAQDDLASAIQALGGKVPE